MFGWLFHLGLDALIISAFLAGIRRSTGLTYVFHAAGTKGWPSCHDRPALSQVPNKDIRRESKLRDLTWETFVPDISFSTRAAAVVSWSWSVDHPVIHYFICLFVLGEYAFDFAVVIFGVCNWHSVSSYLRAHAADTYNSAPVLLRGGIEFESTTFTAPQFPSPANSALLIIPHSLPCNIYSDGHRDSLKTWA